MKREIEILSNDLKELGLPVKDIELIVQALNSHYDDLEYWMAVAAQLRPSYLDETAFHAAEIIYHKAVGRFELSERLANNIGVLYQKWGRLHEAKEWFNTSLKLNPRYSLARHNLAYCFDILEEFKSAEDNYREAIRDNPENIDSWNELANCLWKQGRQEDALKLYYQLIKDPKNSNGMFNLSLRLLSIGKFAKALKFLKKLIQLHPNDQGAIYLRDCARRKEIPQIDEISTTDFPEGIFWRTDVKPDIEVWPMDQMWKAVTEASKSIANPRLKWPPQIFLSYRTESKELDSWIANLADTLVDRGYHVVYDKKFGLKKEIVGIPVVLDQLVSSSYFVPIITEKYRRSVEFAVARDKSATTLSNDDSVVLDEWLAALALASINHLALLGIRRSGPVVPAPFSWETVIDARGEDKYDSLMARFPHLKETGHFMTFNEPISFIDKGLFVTRSAAVSIVQHKLNLTEVFKKRNQALKSVVTEVSIV
ncbi:MAG: tetratricopeptide repeat protein, partial [Candidatus Aminicenantes bacterium]